MAFSRTLTAAPPADAVVVFSELNYNPGPAGDAAEWIELFNANSVAVDLGEWALTGGVGFTFPAGTVLDGGARLVVARTPALFAGSVGPFTGALSNGGETLELRDNNGRMMDQLIYGDADAWPVAADGSGATLAKRDPRLASHDAASWTTSAQAGGTPGTANFPESASTEVVPRAATWRYLSTGVAPAANWRETGFDDSAWPAGPGAFGFGNPVIYASTNAPVSGGIWDLSRWTGDADSGISTARTYTHKVGFNRPSGYTAINGVTFDSPGTSVLSGATWSLSGSTIPFSAANPSNGLPAGTGSRQLCENFFYGSAGGKSRLQLSGLTPGQSYVVTFYAVGYDTAGGRLVRVIPDDTLVPHLVDESDAGAGQGIRLRYHYVAPASGNMGWDFQHVTAATWHHYAFSNEVAPVAPPNQVLQTGVTVLDQSSQLTNASFRRFAVHSVNGSGLTAGQHGTAPEDNMWLSNGNFALPNDLLPAVITYDLGAVRRLTSMHVWNYNEAGAFTSRGANSVQILVATNAAGPFTAVMTNTLIRASGLATEAGQRIALDRDNVRYVRFNITSNHGDASQFAGLSEVQFYTYSPALPQPYREAIAGFFNTGVDAAGAMLPNGSPDPHYQNITGGGAGIPAIVQSNHPAWLGFDGVSQWTSIVTNGTDTVPAQQFRWKTTVVLPASVIPTLDVKLFAAVDNLLDNVLVNGVSRNVSAAGFAAFNGPFSVTGFTAGTNTVELLWTNQGPPGPGGLRLKWDTRAAPEVVATVLPANSVTTWFRTTFNQTVDPRSSFKLRLNHALDDGAVFYLNGVEIHRVNLPANPTPATLASAEVLYPTFGQTVTVTNPPLVNGLNVLSVELHQASAADPDALFLATLVVEETPPAPGTPSALRFNEVAGAVDSVFFVELRNNGTTAIPTAGLRIRSSAGPEHTLAATNLSAGAVLALDQATLGFRPADGDRLFLTSADGSIVLDALVVRQNARALTADGEWWRPSANTPGAANTFAVQDALVISEIQYHHLPVHLDTGTVEDPEEWVELHNRSASAVNLAGWRLRGDIDFDFPTNAVLAAGARLVVSNDPVTLAILHPHLSLGTTLHGPMTGSLPNSGGTIRLEGPDGNPADTVTYLDGGRWDGRADGGGATLELRDSAADNALPESWTASDETARTQWQTISYSGVAAVFPGSNEPATYHELVLGLLEEGEVLLDDISVKEVSAGNRELVQDGQFTSGSTATWRLLGNHGTHNRSVVVPDPDAPGNNVLRLLATGATEHMHNHAETTFRNAGSYVTINPASTYDISFRARWQSGSPRLLSRLYFNRLARQHILPTPVVCGTPGLPNSRAVANAGPDISGLRHSPILPLAGEPVTVTARIADTSGVAAGTLQYRLDGATVFTAVPMSFTNGLWSAALPGQASGALAQFYVTATDGAGAVSAFPAEGPDSRALVRWDDGVASSAAARSLRILMLTADADLLHSPTNVMSNHSLPCTVLDGRDRAFLHSRVRLKSSERGRNDGNRVGFTLSFDPTELFRGAHRSISLDRSCYGRGTIGNGNGLSDIVSWHFLNRTGGVPSMYNDIAYLVAPRAAQNGSAQLVMAEYNDVWLDSSFTNGSDTPVFKYELIYYPTTTQGGGPEGYKLPQPDAVLGVEFGTITSPDKEAFRWNFLIGNARGNDDYRSLIRMSDTYRLSGAAFNAAIPEAIDVDQWLRAAAALALAGVGDNYISSAGAWHNLKLYHRADGRILYLPWDLDFQNQAANAALIINPDISALTGISPQWNRRFHQHLRDIIDTSFNNAYLNPWVDEFQSLNTTGGDWNSIKTYVNDRVAFVNGQLAAGFPAAAFAITTNGGADFVTTGSTTTLEGTGDLSVHGIRRQPGNLELTVTWTAAGAWSVSVPLTNGVNTVTLEALDRNGAAFTSDTIAITSSGGVPLASAATLTISELHYHPADPTAAEQTQGITDADDFEFVELLNISATGTISLAGCRFTEGITHALPHVTLAPGERLVIPRRTAAFALRHPGTPTAPEYYQPNGNLFANGGEPVRLVDATGADIMFFTYSDGNGWPASADGHGPSLVRIAPASGAPANHALQWRGSAGTHGNPGASDALAPPVNPNGDDDADQVLNWVEQATGTGGAPALDIGYDTNGNPLWLRFVRDPLAEAGWTVETGPGLTAWTDVTATFRLDSRAAGPGGTETVTLRRDSPSAETRGYFRARLTRTAAP